MTLGVAPSTWLRDLAGPVLPAGTHPAPKDPRLNSDTAVATRFRPIRDLLAPAQIAVRTKA